MLTFFLEPDKSFALSYSNYGTKIEGNADRFPTEKADSVTPSHL
jgi:hypothetical protein